MDAFVILAAVVGVGAGAGVYGLTMRDYIRRGRLRRRKERLQTAGVALTLPDGRVPCPQCGEAIMPTARRCPWCRSVVIDRI
jgi:ribosomal protein L32